MALNPQYQPIAQTFVQQYYQFLDDPAQRVNMANFYNEEKSLMTFEGQQLFGRAKIMEKVQGLQFQKIAHSITMVDSHPMFNGGILVSVLGQLKDYFHFMMDPSQPSTSKLVGPFYKSSLDEKHVDEFCSDSGSEIDYPVVDPDYVEGLDSDETEIYDLEEGEFAQPPSKQRRLEEPQDEGWANVRNPSVNSPVFLDQPGPKMDFFTQCPHIIFSKLLLTKKCTGKLNWKQTSMQGLQLINRRKGVLSRHIAFWLIGKQSQLQK
ncbi:NUTF2 [Cordylochernes scorpioides]|uniref:NUTF2 n=1 Tax=Cordylochernes scorpioides TaxID=51811 RepID=A0ABY6LRK7_9ARAC|nr:NUTF2 [Cordylochernes scorpioides]